MLAMNFKDKCDSVRILATVSVGALAMATVPAMAQDATAAPQQPAASQTKYDGDAIVVTGITKQDANIQDTPIAITAFSGETLTEQGIGKVDEIRSEEHTSELQSLMRISYAVFCLKKTQHTRIKNNHARAI